MLLREERKTAKMKCIKVERAIERLNLVCSGHYSDLHDCAEQVNTAVRMGMDALRIIHAAETKGNRCETPTNAEVLLQTLAAVVQSGKDEDGFPEMEYETVSCLTSYLSCPYTCNPLCPFESSKHPDAYADCDACKAHWLMAGWTG